jgi:glycosyltransferase involved in cell wall biosynthesis
VAMLAKDPPIRAYVIGGPIYATDGSQYTLDELRSLAFKLGIAQCVGFAGFVKDPAAAIRALDVVVHASTQPEPFGLVVAEAMACGKPVVVSLAGGVTEIISEHTNALSHRPGDAAEMAGCIARLAADSRLREEMGGQARRWAEQRFHSSRLAKEIPLIYRSFANAAK